MRNGVLVWAVLLAGACDGGGTSSACDQVRACCPSGPLGGIEECDAVAAAGDAEECGFYLEDARAEGQCGGAIDAGGATDGGGSCVGLDQAVSDACNCCSGLHCVGSFGGGFFCRACIASGGMGCNGAGGTVAPCCDGLYCRADPGTTGVCSPCLSVGEGCAGGGISGECCGDLTCSGVFPSLTCQPPE